MEKIKDRSFFLFWFQFVFFYFGLCFEFLIELLKKIEVYAVSQNLKKKKVSLQSV